MHGKVNLFYKSLQVFRISSAESDGTVKLWRFLQRSIDSEDQVMLLTGY